jgi:hypothetical protein
VTIPDRAWQDPLIGSHLQPMLSTSPGQTGLVMMAPCVTYILACSFLVHPVAVRMGNKLSMLLGLGLGTVSFLIFGPAPFLKIHAGLKHTPRLSGVCVGGEGLWARFGCSQRVEPGSFDLLPTTWFRIDCLVAIIYDNNPVCLIWPSGRIPELAVVCL